LYHLKETFGTFVGANLYLTPPDAQGFAPHWDDIEAFVLQIEGKKRWKLYRPRNPNEVLPRYSSKDLGKEEDTLEKPFIDVIMQPGDLLYFPRYNNT
jgi:lysine-specific demethylase/histidyl-hydroxylase NO66